MADIFEVFGCSLHLAFSSSRRRIRLNLAALPRAGPTFTLGSESAQFGLTPEHSGKMNLKIKINKSGKKSSGSKRNWKKYRKPYKNRTTHMEFKKKEKIKLSIAH